MRWSPKLIAVFLCLGLVGGALGAKDDKPKGDAKKDESGKKKKDKEKDKKAGPPATADGKPQLDIPLVSGHPSKGLKIPYYGLDGKLQMLFQIGVADRIDNRNVRLSEMQVETYDATGTPEMTIDFPVSIMDMTTRIISSQTKTTIRRADFMITGDAVEFDTNTRAGKLVGNVHMTIYDEAQATVEAPVVEFAPK